MSQRINACRVNWATSRSGERGGGGVPFQFITHASLFEKPKVESTAPPLHIDLMTIFPALICVFVFLQQKLHRSHLIKLND